MASAQIWSGSLSDDDIMHDYCNGTSSAVSSSASSSSKYPRMPPKCAFCRNHGYKIRRKGHKRFCQFSCCDCEKCRLTTDRHKLMAIRAALLRAEVLDEQRTLQPGEIPPLTLSDILSTTSMSSKPLVEYLVEDLPMPVSNSNSVRPQSFGMASSSNTQLQQQTLIEICKRFSKKWGYPWEMLPLLYSVLFLVDGDEEKASLIITEGHAVIEDYTKLHNLNIDSDAEI